MRVLIADDHAVFRRGLRETIGEAFPKVTFGEAETAHDAIECVRRQDWEIVIMDISMPGKSGLDILDDLKRLRPKLPVLFLSMHPEEQYARRALKAGAAGYLTKESVPEELKKAVRRVQLSLSVKTVSTYRSRILEKTGMKTTAELIRFALQSQLVD